MSFEQSSVGASGVGLGFKVEVDRKEDEGETDAVDGVDVTREAMEALKVTDMAIDAELKELIILVGITLWLVELIVACVAELEGIMGEGAGVTIEGMALAVDMVGTLVGGCVFTGAALEVGVPTVLPEGFAFGELDGARDLVGATTTL